MLLGFSLIGISWTSLGLRNAGAAEVAATLVPVADTGLYEIAPTNNLGGSLAVPVGVHSGGERSRYVVRFDPGSSLPLGAVVTGAELRIQVTAASTPSADYNVRRVLRDWAEDNKGGNNGAPASTGETSWLARFHPSTVWASPGGSNGIDYAESASATVTLGDAGSTNLISSPGLAADVQLWLDQPGTNFGWMLRAVDESATQIVRRIASRETVTNSPVLKVSYRVGPVLHSAAVSNGVFSFCFLAESNRAYSVEYAGAVPAGGTWQSVSNIPPAVFDRELCFVEVLSSSNRFYRVVEE
jgi:hypothetical protein